MALLRFALAPAFQAAAGSYAPFLEDPPWDRAVCPVCDAAPLLGELRGGESRRVLRCGRCGAAWSCQRQRCVVCDTRDHRKLTALHREGQGDFLRIDACDNCGGYIKTMARLDPIPCELLPAEDLATAHLDLLAIECGYRRP
jgi:FdhE protein